MKKHRLLKHRPTPNQKNEVGQDVNAIYNIQMAGEEVFVSTQTSLQIYHRSPDGASLTKVFSRPFYYLQWTMTDMDVSLQQDSLVHSSLNSRLGLFRVESRSYQAMVDVSGEEGEDEGVRVSSVKFSRDGRQLVCGTQVVES